MEQNTQTMDGIIYLRDESSGRRFAQIDLDQYGEDLEDFLDGLIVKARRNEETVTLEEVAEELIKAGKLEKDWKDNLES